MANIDAAPVAFQALDQASVRPDDLGEPPANEYKKVLGGIIAEDVLNGVVACEHDLRVAVRQWVDVEGPGQGLGHCPAGVLVDPRLLVGRKEDDQPPIGERQYLLFAGKLRQNWKPTDGARELVD